LTLPAAALAQFNYTVAGGAVTITEYTGPGGAVVIPSTIVGLPVTQIGNYAFFVATGLTSVAIPSTVTNIGDYAFRSCTSLTSITIPDSVTRIGEGALSFCPDLSAINVGAANAAYSSLEGVLFNKSRTMLLQCPGGKSGSYSMPNTVTTVGDYALAVCTSLTSITIPNSVTQIGWGAFAYCTSLTAINVAVGNAAFSSLDGVLFNQSRTILLQCPGGKMGSYAVPSTVTTIADNAFSICPSLTSITIPNPVTSIGWEAFSACPSLTAIYFRGNSPSVANSAFVGTDQVVVYYLPGTPGWGGTFAGRPTAVWQPRVLTNDPSFGVRTNAFGFTIAWAGGMAVAVDACVDLTHLVWVPLRTNNLTTDTLYFSDPQWTNSPRRFYRVRWP